MLHLPSVDAPATSGARVLDHYATSSINNRLYWHFIGMSSLRKRGNVWYACVTQADGRQAQVSTKIRDIGTREERAVAKRDALIWAQTLEEQARGHPSGVQMKRAIDAMMDRMGRSDLAAETAEAFFTNYLVRVRRLKTKGTARSYCSVISRFVRDLGPDKARPLADIGVRRIQQWLDSRIDAGARVSSLRVSRAILATAFKHAIREGLVTQNPATLVELPASARANDKLPFNTDQISAILRVASPEWKTMVLLGMCCGCRIYDAATMPWSAVSFETRILRWVPQKTKKHGTEVIVPLGEVIFRHLQAVRAADPAAKLICPKLAALTKAGSNGLCWRFRDLIKKAGIQAHVTTPGIARIGVKYSYHSLRHLFCTALMEAGVAIETRKSMAGHLSDAAHARYTHVSVSALRSAVDLMPVLELPSVDKPETGEISVSKPKTNRN